MEQDVIFVGGGNTKSALVVWRVWGVDEVLRRPWEHGVLLFGMNAGAICWFQAGLVIRRVWAGP
jgi:dipeptidase E